MPARRCVGRTRPTRSQRRCATTSFLEPLSSLCACTTSPPSRPHARPRPPVYAWPPLRRVAPLLCVMCFIVGFLGRCILLRSGRNCRALSGHLAFSAFSGASLVAFSSTHRCRIASCRIASFALASAASQTSLPTYAINCRGSHKSNM